MGQLSLREVGEVVAFLAPPPPVTNCQPRARNSVPGIPHWPSGRLMGFLFCRGLKFRPRVQVFREALNHERLPRTATHTLAARVAHTRGRACRLRCAGWVDSRDESVQHRSPRFFHCGLDRLAVIRPSTTALSLSHCLHVAPRLMNWLECLQLEGGWLCNAIRLLRLPSEEHMCVRLRCWAACLAAHSRPPAQFAGNPVAHRRTRTSPLPG